MSNSDSIHEGELSEILGPLLWDIEREEISWEKHRDFIIQRVLRLGSWEMITWLRSQVGDDGIREWLESHHGRGLSPRQLRFWALLLDLPPRQVARWIHQTRNNPWETRTAP